MCLEHRGTWPPDITAHRDPAVRAFLHRVTAAGWRPLLVRRPGRRPTDGPTRVFLVDTVPANARVTVLRISDPAELAGLVLPGPGEPLPGTVVADPMLLVCTHGRRDRCCAVDGRALTGAVLAAEGQGEGASWRASGRTGPASPSDADGPDVWECTHLGGHRFAPTALVLPTGYVYGRLDVPGAVAALKAAGVGEVEPTLCRGRSTWSAPGQVAELAVRAATGLRGADALSVDVPEPAAGTDDAGVVVTARDGRRWEVTVRSAACPGGSRPVSCGAAALPVTALHASAVTPLPGRRLP